MHREKNTKKKAKRKVTKWEKKVLQLFSQKDNFLQTKKKLLNFNKQNTKTPQKKWKKNTCRQLMKRNIEVAHKHISRYSSSFTIKGKKI